jgi:hypothetical protein
MLSLIVVASWADQLNTPGRFSASVSMRDQ